jgi:hypothetical protein
MQKNEYGPNDPRECALSDHALVRWIERRHGIDLEAYRRFVAILNGSNNGRRTDRVMIRGLEKGLGIPLDDIRDEIRHEMRTGEMLMLKNKLNILTSTGHELILLRNNHVEWSVATVLYRNAIEERSRRGEIVGIMEEGVVDTTRT